MNLNFKHSKKYVPKKFQFNSNTQFYPTSVWLNKCVDYLRQEDSKNGSKQEFNCILSVCLDSRFLNFFLYTKTKNLEQT